MSPHAYEPTFYLLKHRLPPSESTNLLGRIIRRYQDPTLDYTPDCPSTALSPPENFSRFLLPAQHSTDAHLTACTTASSSRYLKFLARLFSSGATSASTTIASPRVTTRRLKLERDTLALTQRGKEAGVALPLGMAAGVAGLAGGVPLPGVGAEVMPDLEAGVGRTSSSASMGTFSTSADGDGEGREEVFAIACKVITRTWKGIGRDVRVRCRQPEYRGGQHFGDDGRSDSDEEDSEKELELTEEDEAALAEGFEMVDGDFEGFGSEEVSLFNPDKLYRAFADDVEP
ncbi:hypothetical protein VTI74DRAFT_9237 [Chaetomium olivicolor]